MDDLLYELRNAECTFGNAITMTEAADEIETLHQRVAELGRYGADADRKAKGFENMYQQAEAALTEARARLAAADRMAEALEDLIEGERDTLEAEKALTAYRKETGQ